MAKRRSRRGKPLPKEPVSIQIDSLSHEGRGVGRLEGKTVFVSGALPGETAEMQYTFQRGKFDEGRAISIANPHENRVEPPCAHYDVCGGCSLQHLSLDAQIEHKQSILKEQFDHFAQTQPERWLAPLQADQLAYRRKARLGVRYVLKKEKTLIGFREKYSNFLAEIEACPVLDKRVSDRLSLMSQLIDEMQGRLFIPQIEVACGDKTIALIVRHLKPLSESDRALWVSFAKDQDIDVYLQPKGPNTVHRIWPPENNDDGAKANSRLSYELAEYGLEMLCEPLDFTQVNASINRKMIPMALDLLEVNSNDNVLDLFCGLGNFTLPLATKANYVVGVEGVQEMVDRGTKNADHNNLSNVEFHQADLAADLSNAVWLERDYNKILIDPARSGALEVIKNIVKLSPEKIVYVSCNPATLARDTGELVKSGYKLIKAGVMDMFPHTTHVESIALFEKAR